MAVHGALLAESGEATCAGAAPRVGYLASVRSVTLHVQRLDTIATDLTVTAERLLGDANHILYSFTARSRPATAARGPRGRGAGRGPAAAAADSTIYSGASP